MAQQPRKQNGKPNILVIWGDDIGISNLSCYSHGLMGYRTPNIDRLAKEGMMFTDSYGEQSCTAGTFGLHHGPERLPHRSVQSGHARRAAVGMMDKIVTIAGAAQEPGLCDRAVRQEPPRRPEPACCRPCTASTSSSAISITSMPKKIRRWRVIRPTRTFPGSRRSSAHAASIHSWATDEDDPTEEPRWGRVGKQRIEDTGPLNRKRMETCDEEFVAAAMDFMKRVRTMTASRSSCGSTRPTCTSSPTPSPRAKARPVAGSRTITIPWSTMTNWSAEMLDFLDELGIADDTFVMYSTDNGPHRNTWPDGGTTPFRSEKNTNWEGAFRVPLVVRWPGHIEAGSISNGIVQHHDWLPTFLAMAGAPDVVDKLKKGHQAIGRTYKNHIDGYNLLPYLTGEQEKSPRQTSTSTSATTATCSPSAYDNWKVGVHGAAASGHAGALGANLSCAFGFPRSST